MPAKFGRDYILTIFPPYQVQADGKLVPSGLPGVEIKFPLTCEFSIQRNTLGSSNQATFRIYNLAEETRNQLYKDKIVNSFIPITLQAGYSNPLPIVFKGNILEAKSYRAEGSVDFITEINAYDMGFAMQSAWTSQSFPSGTKQSSVIDYLINDLKKYFIERGVVSDYSGSSYDRQRSLFGRSWEILQTEKGKGSCFIDNGKVHILKDGDAFEGSVTVISAETGMLGVPTKADSYVVADILFEPQLVCGQLVDLDSKTNARFNARRQVIGIQHSGIISGSVNGKCRTRVTMYYNIAGFTALTS